MALRSAAASLAALLVTLVAVLPANAATRGRGADASSDATQAAVAPNNYKAGYTAAPTTGSLRHATARFTVPALDCRPRNASIGLGIGSEPTAGHPDYLTEVVLACVDGAPVYTLEAIVSTALGRAPAAAGDKVKVAIRTFSGNEVRATIRDLTSGVVITKRAVVYPRVEDAVDYGAFPRYGRQMRLVPDFDKIGVRHAKITGGDMETCISETGAERNTRLDEVTGDVEIDTSDLTRCQFAILFESR